MRKIAIIILSNDDATNILIGFIKVGLGVIAIITISLMMGTCLSSFAKAQEKVYAIQTGWHCGKVIELNSKPYVLDTLKHTTDTTILQKHK